MPWDDLSLLKDLHYPDAQSRIWTWPFVQVNERVRIYYDRHDQSQDQPTGFRFYVVSYEGRWMPNDRPMWDETVTMVRCLVYGVAYFDGIRHLYMGDEQTGNFAYINYPTCTSLAQVFTSLRQLELQYCWDVRQELQDRMALADFGQKIEILIDMLPAASAYQESAALAEQIVTLLERHLQPAERKPYLDRALAAVQTGSLAYFTLATRQWKDAQELMDQAPQALETQGDKQQ